MITLLGSSMGFFSSAISDLVKLWCDSADRKHEITILKMQMAQQKHGYVQRLEEINVQANISESHTLYKTYNTGIGLGGCAQWHCGSCACLCVFLLYVSVKWTQLAVLLQSTTFFDALPTVWHEEYQAIFASIIGFYFGQRAMSKLQAGR